MPKQGTLSAMAATTSRRPTPVMPAGSSCMWNVPCISSTCRDSPDDDAGNGSPAIGCMEVETAVS